MVSCPKCGNQNDVALGQTACFQCGTELSGESVPAPKIQPAAPGGRARPARSFWRFEDRGPFTLNGFGTTFYGKRDFRADGSYITTEWIVLAYLPLIPIRSLRVSYRGPGERRSYQLPDGLAEGSIVKIRGLDSGRYDVEFDRKVFNVPQVCVSFKGETGALL